MISNYRMEKRIGKGQFGEVYRVRHVANNEYFALKKVPVSGVYEMKLAQIQTSIAAHRGSWAESARGLHQGD